MGLFRMTKKGRKEKNGAIFNGANGLSACVTHLRGIGSSYSKVVDLQIEKGNVRTLIFDFSGITFMDSSGIGMVMGRHRKMNFLGGRTFVTGIGDNVDRIFRMSGLYRIIPKYQERTEVL